MYRIEKAARAAVGLGVLSVLGFTFYPIFARAWDQRPNQPAVAESAKRVFYARVEAMRPAKGGVSIKPQQLWHVGSPPPISVVGTNFRIQDRHWNCQYTVKRIETDGILVYYQYRGQTRASRGDIKLTWK